LTSQNQAPIDSGGIILGLVLGTLIGGVAALFKAPLLRVPMRHQHSGTMTVKPEKSAVKAEPNIPADPVAESRAQGKAAATRRRSELGI
jgi:hypothetical protein